MNGQSNRSQAGGALKEVGNQSMRTVAWFAVAAVVVLVSALRDPALCALDIL
jgi:hypothetical protein